MAAVERSFAARHERTSRLRQRTLRLNRHRGRTQGHSNEAAEQAARGEKADTLPRDQIAAGPAPPDQSDGGAKALAYRIRKSRAAAAQSDGTYGPKSLRASLRSMIEEGGQ